MKKQLNQWPMRRGLPSTAPMGPLRLTQQERALSACFRKEHDLPSDRGLAVETYQRGVTLPEVKVGVGRKTMLRQRKFEQSKCLLLGDDW